MIQSIRTPDERFEHLPGYNFDPNYIEDLPGYEGLRIHYVDEGPKDAEQTFLCLHGQPTWSYLYRKMIPILQESGARVIAPDWLGFGRSDKPTDLSTYSFHFHRSMMIAFIKSLNLKNITLVCQDWGGVLGLTIPQEMPQSFTRLVVMNTAISTGQGSSPAFRDWLKFIEDEPDVNVAAVIARSSSLNNAELAAYDAPFPSLEYKAGPRTFPGLVMTDPGMEGVETSKRAKKWWSEEWTGKSFMAVGMKDSIISFDNMKGLQSIIKGCPNPFCIEGAGHFVQEWGEDIAHKALEVFGDV